MARLSYFRCPRPNFGDELNPWLWPQLLPGLLDDSTDDLFLGIGTLLNDRIPQAPRKIVFGSGYGYGRPPRLEPGKWRIHCVRGPLTASALGLPPQLAICDPAILLRRIAWPAPLARQPIAFMPHWESLAAGHWPAVCAEAGVHFIDPTGPVEEVVAQLRGAELVITEAMHGAIVADALRTPWIAVQPQLHIHRPKWLDWCASLAVDYRPQALQSSGYQEFFDAHWRRTRARLAHGRRAVAGAVAGLLGQAAAHRPPAATADSAAAPRRTTGASARLQNALARRLDARFIRAAAADLRRIAGAAPTLSSEPTIERLTVRLEERLATLKAELAAGSF